MRTVVTDEAAADLEEIGDRISQDSPRRAESFIREIVGRIETLATMPNAFSLIPRYEQRGIRRIPHGNYLIFYRVEADCVVILHILHGARDFEAILFPDENGR